MLTSPQDTNGFKFSTYYISTNLNKYSKFTYSKKNMLDLSLNKKNVYYIYEQIHNNDSVTKMIHTHY